MLDLGPEIASAKLILRRLVSINKAFSIEAEESGEAPAVRVVEDLAQGYLQKLTEAHSTGDFTVLGDEGHGLGDARKIVKDGAVVLVVEKGGREQEIVVGEETDEVVGLSWKI
jgi:hypothetical protein